MAGMEMQQADSAAAASSDDASLPWKIRAQVEYYLSKQNLLQDHYLQTKMDKDYFVDLSVIAEFKLIRQLTTDLDLILSSIKDSDKDLAKTLKWGDKTIGVGIKSEKVIPLAGSTSPPGAASGTLPYYMPMNSGSNGGFAPPNGGGFNPLYVGGGDGAGGNYRQGGRPGNGGRRPPGMNGGAMAYDGSDSSKRAAAGAKKGKGKGRDGNGREGGSEGGRAAGGNASLGGMKETMQAPIDLADFPVLEANPAKKKENSGDAHKSEAGAKGAEDASQPEDGSSQSSAMDAGATDLLSPTSPSKAGTMGVKKLSYAQMAQQAAAANAAAAASQAAATSSGPVKAAE